MANPWEIDWGNQAGPVYGPAPKPPAPRDPLQIQKDQIDIQKGQADLANLPLEAEKARLDMEKTRLDMEKARQTGGGDQKRAQTIQAITGEVKRLYQQDIKGQPLSRGFGALEYLDTIPSNDRFRAAGNTILPLIRPLVAQTAKEGDSDKEMEVFLSYVPSNDDADITIEQKFKMLDLLVGGMVDGVPPSQTLASVAQQQQGVPAPAAPDALDQSRNPAEIEAPTQEQLAPSTNGMQTVDDPRLSGVRGEYLRRLEAGQGPQELIAYLRQAGISDPKILASAVQQANYRRQNPNVPIANYNTSALDDMDVPLSATESMMNNAAQTGPGAYLMNAGQAASMNTLDNAVGMAGGNAERARLAIQDSQFTNPLPATLGQISGSVMGALGGEAALASRGIAAGLPRALAADMTFGAGSGAGAADNGDRLSGAVTGGLSAGAGSLAGAGIMRAGGSIVSPSGGRLADLYQQGVRPTPGQRLIEAGDGKGLAGLAGRAVNAAEEGLSSVPIVGSAIRGARQDARDQFQVGAFNQVLGELGSKLPKGMQPGTRAHKFTQEAIDKAYDKARSGLTVAADEQLASEIANLSGDIGNLAEPSVKRFEQIVKNVIIRRTGEVIDGANYKKIQSELGKIIRSIRKSPSGDGELADSLESLRGIMDGAARRSSDPAAVEALDAADRAYAKFVRIEDASRGSEAGTFSPTQLNQSVRRNSSRIRSKAFNQGEALMQDYAQQGMSLVDRMPNSGSADRLFMGAGAAGGAAMLEPSSLGVLGVLGALYAPGVRKATAGAMAPRGKKAKAIADAMKKRARITGAVGAGAALSAQKDDDQ